MLSLENLINIFYSKNSEKEKNVLLVNCQEGAREYYPESWKSVNKIDLASEKIKMNLIYTFYQSQFGDCEGVAIEILRSLHGWSGGTINFDLLSVDDNIFYEDLYLFFAVDNFQSLDIYKQRYFLETRFLIKSFIRDLPLYQHVQINFSYFNGVDILQSDAILLAGAIARNDTPLDFDSDQPSGKTISEWVKDFDNFSDESENKLELFFQQFAMKKNIDAYDMTVLAKVLNLYWRFSSGQMWREIDYSLFPYEPLEKGGYELNENDAYIEFLNGLDQLSVWMRDAEKIAEWLSKKEIEFIYKVFEIIKKKVDFNNQEELDNVAMLSEYLLKNNVKIKDGLFYFDMKSGQFIWNENI